MKNDGQRVEQQFAIAAALGAGVRAAAVEQGHLARNFHLTAVAAFATAARPDAAGEGGGFVRPDDDLAAIALEQCIGQQAHAMPDPADAGVAHLWIGALPVATDQD